MLFTDSHAHLTFPDFDADRQEVLRRAREAGLRRVCTVGSLATDAGEALALAEGHDFICFAAGLHPHEARLWDPAVSSRLEDLARHPRFVAVGEIGLDYHYDRSPREQQREIFREQIRVARRLGLPLLIHTREAEDDTLRILEEEKAEEVGGVFHCFSGSEEMARYAVEHGYRVSFSGSITFQNAGDLRRIAAGIPEELLLTETDAPFLSPHPYRGRRNEPLRVVEVVRKLAEIRGTTAESLGERTTRNFEAAFPRLRPA